MNLEDFLSARSTDLPSIVANVKATIGLDAGDVLLAVGSIVENLGSSKSDLDLLLITPRPECALPSQDSVALVVGKCLIDVRLLRRNDLDKLLARFETWSLTPWNVMHAVKFTIDERTLLHRLLHGVLLIKSDADRVTTRTPGQKDLARLKLHVARQNSRTIQVDMVGYKERGDYRSLGFAAQELLGQAMDALTAGYELTNPLIKWRSRMLDLVPSDWERPLAVRPTGLLAGERVWRLHRAPERHDRRRSLQHALRITSFTRAVFMWAELQLVHGAVARAELGAWSRLKPQSHDPLLPCLEFDVDFFLTDDGATIARLNEFSDTLEISVRDLALVLLFDGTTTVREAELVARTSRKRKTGSQSLDRLVSQVVRTGLGMWTSGA